MKRYLPRSIFARSLMIVLAPIVILQIVLAIVFYERHWENVTQYRAGAVAGDILALIWAYRLQGVDDPRPPALGQRFFRFTSHLEAGGRLEAARQTPQTRVERLLGQALRNTVRLPFVIDTSRPPDTVVRLGLDEGVLVVRIPKRRLESRTTDLFIFWMVGTSAALALIAAYFVRQQIRPINRLAAAAGKFGRGIIDVEFKPSGATEVRSAAEAFLSMRDQIRRHIEQRTLMLASVSHDLRSPLTRMKLELAFLGDSEEVENLRRDIEEMEHMIDLCLDFAKGQGEEASREFDLAAVIREVAGGARAPVAARTGGALPFTGRKGAIKRCLTNIVDNACRYGSATTLEVRRENGAIAIVLDDDGPGIPESSRGRALQPFVRLEDSRDPNLGGNGLGLAIANDVVRSHGGALDLEDSPAGGLRVRITLPTGAALS